ncbi:hypothetical protein ACW7BJ_07780, partial [Azospirillum argentinense]
ELVEQRLLHHRPLAHHRCVLLLPRRIESGLQAAGNTDFFNTIRHVRIDSQFLFASPMARAAKWPVSAAAASNGGHRVISSTGRWITMRTG